MSTRNVFVCVLVAGLAVALSTLEAQAKQRSWDHKTREVHEWGTLTSVQGSDGVTLDGLRHEERDLPSFVHHLRDVNRLTGVSPKMETPVIYFYTPEERRMRVSVTFPHGLITQWYPAATSSNASGLVVNGNGQPNEGQRVPLRHGHILWGQYQDLHVLGPKVRDPGFPAVADDDPWRFCRQTEANAISVCRHNRVRNLPKNSRPKGTNTVNEYERCLFYRGLGDFSMPLSIEVFEEKALADNKHHVRLRIRNTNPKEPVRHHVLICVRGNRFGFHILNVADFRSAAGGTCVLDMKSKADTEATAILLRDLAERLVSLGLFTDEAYAMGRTWQHGWLGDEGLRMLYTLPRPYVDRVLPLHVSTLQPRAAKKETWRVERVFVGRVDLLSPTREAKLKEMTSDLLSPVETVRQQAVAEFEAMGRFAAPYLRRAMALADNEVSRRALEEQLKRHR